MAAASEQILGPDVAARFGASFPIRLDYLDTLEGGHLSIQCHPSEEYARDVFGIPYTQHETYYVVDTTPGAKVFLGLREDADLDAFREAAEAAERPGIPFDPERFLQAHPAEQHRLYLIPAGTPHASGAGNLVLEISATPYLYTLRFYDWLRRNLDGELRPVHLAHAFANLDPTRRGESVQRDLVQDPVVKTSGPGFAELGLGRARRALLRGRPPRLRQRGHRRDAGAVPRAQPRRWGAGGGRDRAGRRPSAVLRRDARDPRERRGAIGWNGGAARHARWSRPS